jgi:UDP-glucose 4-epimerase
LGKIIRNETIHIWGNGNVVRDFIYVNDLVDAFYRVITYNTNSNVFNIGSGEGYSLNDLLTIMKNVTGRDLSVEYTKSRTYDVPKIYLDISRARKELNWEPRTTLQEGIKLTWEYITHLSDFE